MTGRYAEAGAKLRALRLALPREIRSHDKVAAAASTSRSHLFKLEKGIHKPTEPMMAALSAVLGEDVESFYEVETPDDGAEDDMAAALAQMIRSRVDAAVARALREAAA